MKSTLHFCGGAGSVTGANFLLEDASALGKDGILVDCGLFQGSAYAEATNEKPFPYAPASISHLLVTHAHIDHIGRIPKLVREGFRGTIISTEATRALAEPLLLDSQALLAREARDDGKELLYSVEDVRAALVLWKGVPYQQEIQLPHGYQARLLNAGHILGSAMVEIVRGNNRIVFTGDLGNDHSLLVGPVDDVDNADYFVMESVYGDKKQEHVEDRALQLERVIEATASRGGTLLIPAFSTERTQDLIFEIRNLFHEKKVPPMLVYVDSPLAIKITEAFSAHPNYFRDEIRQRVERGEKLFSFPELRFVTSPQESAAIHKNQDAKIIIAGSGMSQGGRVLSHERVYLPDEHNTLLIVGYQAAGSIGRQLIEGAKTLSVHKEKIEVRAHVETIYGYSAHRDTEGLLSFVHRSAGRLQSVFVVMGEPKSSLFLVQRIRDFIGIQAEAPQQGTKADLNL